MSKNPFKTAYGQYEHPGIMFPEGSSLTKQSFKDECDVNSVMARFERTGQITHVTQNAPQYVDVPETVDYHSALNLVIQAQDSFQNLPSKVRKRFKNNPGAFLEFMQDSENEMEMRELGLLPPAEPANDDEPTETPPEPKVDTPESSEA